MTQNTQTEYFDRRMALEMIEDAFTNLDYPENRGMATGLCSAFYVCGLLERREWVALLERIPPEHGRLPQAVRAESAHAESAETAA